MLAYIRFADQKKPINMNVKCGVAIEYIRKCANLDSSLILDFCDKDGSVKLLRQNLTSYATSYLSSGETYYLVSAKEEGKHLHTLQATLKPDETPFDIKPTKLDKRETKRPPPKLSPKVKRPK